ncbi:MAG: aminotransferase class IV [Tepidisphaeraceae bacterium]
MSDLCWLNGKVVPLGDARISVEDRGFQFADGVYEVIRLYGGKPFAMDLHLHRLKNSCEGLQLPMPMPAEELARQMSSLVKQTGIGEGLIYLQVTRGSAPRSHVFPAKSSPTVLFYTRSLTAVEPPDRSVGLSLKSVPDERWRRCWVKAIGLTANVLARNAAAEAGADEAVFVDNGIVSECSSSNVFFVVEGKLVTHPVGPHVLPGVTRAVVIECANKLDIEVRESPPRIVEAKNAQEIFITSTTRQIEWVGKWDGQPVGGGRCGPVTMRLHAALEEYIRRDLGK